MVIENSTPFEVEYVRIDQNYFLINRIETLRIEKFTSKFEYYRKKSGYIQQSEIITKYSFGVNAIIPLDVYSKGEKFVQNRCH